jgi:tetratricopeptide (TPR) repeat protein
MTTLHPALALRAFRRFLDRWPDHARAAEARATVTDLERLLAQELPGMGLSGDDALELAALHEEARYLLEHEHYAQGRAVAEQLLRRQPDFVPALNNISQTYAMEGRFDQAIATARRVLAIAPDNIHALGNLGRYLCLSGQFEEATAVAERLKALDVDHVDLPTKQAETLSYLGDDEGVLAAYRRAEQRDGRGKPLEVSAVLCHLAAVAAHRLGQTGEAQRLWRQALARSPGFALAQANLDDLRAPVEQRHAPWPWTLAYWLPGRALSELQAELARASQRDDEESMDRVMRRYLRRHPALATLAPLLLDRGDPAGRTMAFYAARALKTPELLAALRDFAFSQRGPDELRHKAAAVVSDAGLLPAGPVRLWLKGEWHEVQLLGFEVHDEPDPPLPSPAQERLEEAMAALHGGDGATAERLLTEGLAVAPAALPLRNNLVAAYRLQGREAEAEALIREIHARHPDYLFGRVNMAYLTIQAKQLDEAQALLAPLVGRQRYHVSEFAALCQVEIELMLARKEYQAAQTWFDLWAGADPDHPALERWRARIALADWPRRLFGRRRRS